VLLRKDPGLEWKPRRVRRQSQEVAVLCNHASARFRLLSNHIAKHATFFVNVILLRPLQLLGHINRKNRQGNQLGVRVLEGSARSLAVILENQDVLEAPVFFQIKNAVTKGPKHIFNSLGCQSTEARIVVGSLDNDFMRAHAVHAVEHALGLAVEAALDAECGKFIGNHPHRPSRRVALRRRSSVHVRTISLNFRRRLGLVTITKRTKAAFQLHTVSGKVSRTLGAVRRNDDPPAYDWILSKLGQALNPFTKGLSVCIKPNWVNGKPFYATGKAFLNSSSAGLLDWPS